MQAVIEKLDVDFCETTELDQAAQDRCRNVVGNNYGGFSSVQLKALKKEVAELKRANGTLKAAASFFAVELNRPHTERFQLGC